MWGPRSLQLSVIGVIGRKGPLTDDELLSELRNGKEAMNFRELNRILEIRSQPGSSRLATNERKTTRETRLTVRTLA